jgi:hypothetical protein
LLYGALPSRVIAPFSRFKSRRQPPNRDRLHPVLVQAGSGRKGPLKDQKSECAGRLPLRRPQAPLDGGSGELLTLLLTDQGHPSYPALGLG